MTHATVTFPTIAPLVIAHRGARAHAPENTLEAAALGHAHHADLWELDVNRTRDGKLVVIHDDTLPRTTDVEAHAVFAARPPFRVCDFTLEELRALDAGSWYLHKDPYGRVAAGEVDAVTQQSYRGIRIPTLEEALRLTRDRDWCVNVEIKDLEGYAGHDTVTAEVLDLIRRMDMVEQVLLSSFQHRYLREAHTLLPELPTGALVEKVRPHNPVELCRKLHAVAYHPDQHILAPGDLAALRDAGIRTNIWTVNDMDTAMQLVAEGATGIITDYPAACLARLQALGHR